jgi:hypothetical protein
MALPTRNLPFEYTQRWTEVGPLLVPTATAETLNLLNKRDKDLEDYLAGLSFGGSKIYCATVYDNLSNGESLSVDLDVPLTARSTVNIQIIWEMSTSIGDLAWEIDATTVNSPVPLYNFLSPWHAGITTAVTRDATFNVEAFMNGYSGDGASSGPCRIDIVAIVGDNTEDDCVQLGGG